MIAYALQMLLADLHLLESKGVVCTHGSDLKPRGAVAQFLLLLLTLIDLALRKRGGADKTHILISYV